MKPLLKIKETIQNVFEYNALLSNKEGYELLQISHNSGEPPFVTMSYDPLEDCILINTELTYPDTFVIGEIIVQVMMSHKAKMGRPYLIQFLDSGSFDVLFGDEAYRVMESQLQQIENAVFEGEDSLGEADRFLLKPKKKNNNSGGLH